MHLLYLHGFNSSSQSHKGRLLQAHMTALGMASQLSMPDIPPQPDLAAERLLSLANEFSQSETLCVAGSSLGGFYATWLAEQFDCKAVLINPAVRPHLLLKKYLGENKNYHTGESWQFEQKHIDALKAMAFDTLQQPQHYLVLLQTGDETLDYRQAEEYYQGANLHIEQGGDHAFQDFEQHLDQILRFCGMLR